MNIFDNGFITLEYVPAIDVIYVTMPTTNDAVLPEVKQSLAIIVEHVRNFYIRNMLLDVRNAKVFINEDAYASMISAFSRDLLSSNLQKLARVVNEDSLRESIVHDIFSDKPLLIAARSFTEVVSAMEWLKANP